VLEQPVALKRSPWAWAVSVLEGVFAGVVFGSIPFDVMVLDVNTKEVAYSYRADNGVSLKSAQQSISQDLATLTVSEFESKYNISEVKASVPHKWPEEEK
jgi:hypothetical protein